MWQLFHDYRRLAHEGKVKHLLCPDCNVQLITCLKPEETGDDVWLWCLSCDSMIKPGLSVLSQIKAVVAEHSE